MISGTQRAGQEGTILIRTLFLGVAIFAFSIAAVGCSDDDGGDDGTDDLVATSTQAAEPTEAGGAPTEPLSSEIPPDVIDAAEEYVVGGSIPSFPATDSLVVASECTTAGQVCYDPDASSFDETEASVRVYPYASDDIQDVTLQLEDGVWVVTGYTDDAIE